jgi:hypothetical protein
MEVLRNELCICMTWIIDGRFACHFMNTHRRPPSCIHDAVVDSKFSAPIMNMHRSLPSQPIGNKVRYTNQQQE